MSSESVSNRATPRRSSDGERRSRIEVHSIDSVPDHERKGKVWHQGPFWFAGNFLLTTMIAGFIGPSLGLSLLWCVLAITLGVLFATVFMAFHANQGPTFGLPQMIQSRAQFGSRGSLIPYTAVVVVYVGFIVFDTILASDALSSLVPAPIGSTAWGVVIIGVGLLIAIIGHDLIHVIQRWITLLLVPTFVLLTIGALLTLDLGARAGAAGFSWTAFMVQFSAAAGYQITYAVYVSDYSRYLPRDVSSRAVIGWTYSGAALSATWMMSLGAIFAAAYASPDVIGSVLAAGNGFIGGFGYFVLIVALPAQLSQIAVSSYGGMLSAASAVDAYKPLKATVRLRVVGLVCVMGAALVMVNLIPDDYLTSFDNYVTLMLFLLIPWSSVNLVDFYFVRKRRYSVDNILMRDGVYGKWGREGLIAYAVGLIAALPFVSLPWYEGPFVSYLGGADVSFVPGLILSGLAYYLLMAGHDVDEELSRASRIEGTG